MRSRFCEVAAQFQEKGLEFLDQGFFQVAFGILVLQPQEFQDEGVLDFLFRRQGFAGFECGSLLEHRPLLP
jgi:hypothetical protein